jgi:hypothetical protein
MLRYEAHLDGGSSKRSGAFLVPESVVAKLGIPKAPKAPKDEGAAVKRLVACVNQTRSHIHMLFLLASGGFPRQQRSVLDAHSPAPWAFCARLRLFYLCQGFGL